MKPAIYIEPEHFADLLRYDGWANQRIMEVVAGLDDPHADDMTRLFAHLLRSQSVWLGRIEEEAEADLPTWGDDTLEDCTRRMEQNGRAWTDFLNTCAPGDFNTEVTYTNSKGERHTFTIGEILTHVVVHGTHHRAQISLLLRKAGLTPPPTDYVVYARETRRRAVQAR